METDTEPKLGREIHWGETLVQAVVIVFFAALGAVLLGLYGRSLGYFKVSLLLGGIAGFVCGLIANGVAIWLVRAWRQRRPHQRD